MVVYDITLFPIKQALGEAGARTLRPGAAGPRALGRGGEGRDGLRFHMHIISYTAIYTIVHTIMYYHILSYTIIYYNILSYHIAYYTVV